MNFEDKLRVVFTVKVWRSQLAQTLTVKGLDKLTTGGVVKNYTTMPHGECGVLGAKPLKKRFMLN